MIQYLQLPRFGRRPLHLPSKPAMSAMRDERDEPAERDKRDEQAERIECDEGAEPLRGGATLEGLTSLQISPDGIYPECH